MVCIKYLPVASPSNNCKTFFGDTHSMVGNMCSRLVVRLTTLSSDYNIIDIIQQVNSNTLGTVTSIVYR